MQFSVMQDRVITYLANRPEPKASSNAEIKEAINQVLMEFDRVFRFHEAEEEPLATIATVADTESYNLPASTYAVWSVYDATSEKRLDFYDATKYDDVHDDDEKGAPSAYHLWANKIYIYPIPDGVYTLELRRNINITQLANPTDVPAMPEELHIVVCIKAAADLALRYRMTETYRELQTAAEIKLSSWQEPHQQEIRNHPGGFAVRRTRQTTRTTSWNEWPY